jgi:hypothetical protein
MQGFSFSPELIADTIACFKDEDGIVLSEEEAIEVLHSFAGLYLAFAGGSGAAAPAALAAETPTPQVLVTPVECCELQHD